MLQGHYETPLVLVSILVAVLASYTALTLAGRVLHSGPRAFPWWIAGGALAMGTGIWSMHFIGMLAFRLPIPLGYDPGITFISWLLPVAVSAAALWVFSRPRLTPGLLGVAAVLVGLGINAMHYVGMAAMQMQPGIRWQPALVAASVVIAITAAGAALWLAFQLRQPRPHLWWYRGGAAVLMGAAIVGMHYTGMAAAGFPEGSICGAAAGRFTLTELAVVVIVATIGILAIAMLTAVYDTRLEARSQLVALAQQTTREREAVLVIERHARAEAERLGELKDQFLATLSHELRTPLNAILGWTQLLRHKRDEASIERGLQTIERNARLQAQLIEDLLDMSRIVSGKLRLEMAPLDPVAVAEAAVESARPTAQVRNIALDVQLQRPAPRIQGDAGRLQQVLWNLLANAIKFTPPGGRVELSLRSTERALVLAVRDSGSGIASEFLPHVFDRFRQADASTTRRHGGLGIGLSIVKQLVELHGGEVEAASDGAGRGSTFTVRLPLLAQDRDDAPVAAPDPVEADAAGAPGVELADTRILVVDDEPDARELLREILGRCGADVVAVESGAEALAQLAQSRFDLLVSDIGMPRMDGYELVRRVRQWPDAEVAGLPSLALSAFSRAEDRHRALASGFDRYMAKPFEAQAFLEQVRALAAGAAAPAAMQHAGTGRGD